MRQVWLTKHGGPEVFELREAQDPQPGLGEVRVRVHAAGVNFADILIRIGLYPAAPKLPAVIGYEIAGVVDEVGEGVINVAAGDRVMALMPNYGGYSDTVVIPVEEAVVIPDSLTFEQAAAVPVNYLTAWLLLVKIGNVQEGERVLIHSVAGGVGQAALQICRWRKAHVVGTASSSKHRRLQENGVEHCIDYRVQDFEEEVLHWTNGTGVDIAIDGLGGASLAKTLRCLGPFGRVLTFGVSSMVRGERQNWPRVFWEWIQMQRINPLHLLDRSQGLIGVNLGSLQKNMIERIRMLDAILLLARTGTFAPVVDHAFRIEEVPEAHRYIQDRRNFGKVVLSTGSS